MRFRASVMSCIYKNNLSLLLLRHIFIYWSYLFISIASQCPWYSHEIMLYCYFLHTPVTYMYAVVYIFSFLRFPECLFFVIV